MLTSDKKMLTATRVTDFYWNNQLLHRNYLHC